MSRLWAAIERHPADRVALADREREITYGELKARKRLVSRGPTDVVGDSTLRAVTELLDAWRLGDPTVLLHPRLPRSEQELISRDVRSAALPDACCAVVATSGTTGKRRYVLLSEDAMLASAEASAKNLGWEEDDRWWLCMPTAHVGGLAIIIRCLFAGQTVFASSRFSVCDFERAVAQGVTLVSLVPTMLGQLVKSNLGNIGRIRAALVGGGPCPPALARQAREAGLPLLMSWGMSEAGSQIATQAYGARFSLTPNDLRSVGRPLSGFELSIRNGVGWVRGAPLTLGYHPPDRYPQPFDTEGWLESQDRLFTLSDGQLSILGRGTDLIVTGGENVYPAEVEAALVAHSDVDAACVVGVSDERWGEIVVAVVVAAKDSDDQTLMADLRKRVGGYKTPRYIIRVSALATNANGKVDRISMQKHAKAQLGQ